MDSLTPIFLDGPLKDEKITVSSDQVEQGIFMHYPADGSSPVAYTFTRVGVMNRIVVVASVTTGIPGADLLANAILSPAALAAEE